MSSARCRGRTDLSEATLKRLLEEEGGNKESRRSPPRKRSKAQGGSTTKVRKHVQLRATTMEGWGMSRPNEAGP